MPKIKIKPKLGIDDEIQIDTPMQRYIIISCFRGGSSEDIGAGLKKNITFLLFSIIFLFLIFMARDEIFWKILTLERNYDIGNYELAGTQGMPLSCMYFCRDSKNKFLISKFGKTRNVQIEFLGCPLVEGDLAWCIWSNNTLSEKDYEKIIQKFNMNTGFEVFQYIYKNENNKKNVLNYLFENSQIR